MRAVEHRESAHENQGGERTLIKKSRSHYDDNHRTRNKLDTSMVEIGSLARSVQRAARQLAAIPRYEVIPFHFAEALRQSQDEVGMQALNVTEDQARGRDINGRANYDESGC
jgi:hypothetical protein